jgi:hypothetical protein
MAKRTSGRVHVVTTTRAYNALHQRRRLRRGWGIDRRHSTALRSALQVLQEAGRDALLSLYVIAAACPDAGGWSR